MANFDWIPYLEGKYMTYYQIGALVFSAIATFFALIAFIIYLIYSKNQSHSKVKNISQNCVINCLSSIPLICAAFDVIYFIEGVILMALILIAGQFVKNYHKITNLEKNSDMGLLQMIKIILVDSRPTFGTILRMIIISLLWNMFFYKTCVCFFDMEISFYWPRFGVGINTYLTRLIQLQKSCPPGPPCHMYATVPENPEQAFFLNIHTHTDVINVSVFYRQLNSSEVDTFVKQSASSFTYQGLEWRTSRNVHSALITNLKPNTKYLTKVFYDGRFWTNAIYKTLPSDPSVPVRMINGGDSGYNHGAVNLSKIVATLNPDIFFMGGDIAYDDNMPACSFTWDYFLGMYGQITTTLGYMMPIVASVGNHDAGLNELPGINITVDNRGPAFLLYFPQHYDRNSQFQIIKRVPPLSNRRTVTSFTFSNVHFTILDTGYLHGFDGWQKQYMIDSFTKNINKAKFVNYHVPIYGVCEAFDRNPKRYLYALFHWVPNFDKFKVMTVFQNHVHAFKRTKPLISSSPVSSGGTVYVGDGSYGALQDTPCRPDATMGIFQTYGNSNNFWMTDVFSDRVEHTAYNSHGKIIDYFVQNISDYKVNIQDIEKADKQVKMDDLLPKGNIFQSKRTPKLQ